MSADLDHKEVDEKKVGWNEGFARMEDSLLGYAEWQNDAFMEHAKRWRELANREGDNDLNPDISLEKG
jgi:hypothetical protein